MRTFPNNLTAMVFGYKEKANFTVANESEISTAPKVDFNPAPAPAKLGRCRSGRSDEGDQSLSCWHCCCAGAPLLWPMVAVPRSDGARGRSDRRR